ncbi:hypothetical protein AALP_AA3G028700 [Arabis alpina]|uniref:Uncharacterized protein n=1 Tax=Arabis alpina TaxID=50452 RepID=A0A087H6N1_ARAAL|nr:hypothetical protein AALP_AA3G028700 [Arabis alpina]
MEANLIQSPDLAGSPVFESGHGLVIGANSALKTKGNKEFGYQISNFSLYFPSIGLIGVFLLIILFFLGAKPLC